MTRFLTSRARSLRTNQTEAEAKLWGELRNRQIFGYKFVRQYPIGRYIVDFCCKEVKLIIEIDGGHHDTNRTYDEDRSARLKALGYKVLRFWNTDVFQNLDGVLESVGVEFRKRERQYGRPSP